MIPIYVPRGHPLDWAQQYETACLQFDPCIVRCSGNEKEKEKERFKSQGFEPRQEACALFHACVGVLAFENLILP